MKILIAEDDPVTCRMLEITLAKAGYDVIVARDGEEAWRVLESADSPKLAVLDWMMPGMDGLEVCRRVRQRSVAVPVQILLLTARDSKEDIVAGLQAGADDYLVKPFDPEELRARVAVGARIVELATNLAERVKELEEALTRVKQLQGLLPICSYCKKIRDDKNYWNEVETYVGHHAEVQFSHGICPECYDKFVKPQLEPRTQPQR
jgi:DNA-binding response OmpR family regulator